MEASLRHGPAIDRLEVGVYEIPTDQPESDGTLKWDSTTLVTVEVHAGGQKGLGWTYDHAAAAKLAESKLAGVVKGRDCFDVAGLWIDMLRAVRNAGRPGIAACAISAVDIALWDLKARLLGLSLAKLLGCVRSRVPIYGSGGFTSYSLPQLTQQLGRWVEQGIPRVKMKVGREPGVDPGRVGAARQAIGDHAELFVDANGAYTRKQALEMAARFRDVGVSWFEEPVSSDDLEGLRLIRERAPAGMEITSGEYGWDPWYFERMLSAGAVDVLQVDGSRCLGITGFVKAAALCEARCLPLSAHCVPHLHVHVCAATAPCVHIEYFHDHVRIERMLFEGTPDPVEGALPVDFTRPGHGLELKEHDAERFAQ